MTATNQPEEDEGKPDDGDRRLAPRRHRGEVEKQRRRNRRKQDVIPQVAELPAEHHVGDKRQPHQQEQRDKYRPRPGEALEERLGRERCCGDDGHVLPLKLKRMRGLRKV